MINNMQNVFFKLLFCTLLFSFLGKVTAQTTMLSHVIAEDPVNFANRDFEAGTLTVTISSLPSSSASVKITLPTGINQVVQLLYHTSLLLLSMLPSSTFRGLHLLLLLLKEK